MVYGFKIRGLIRVDKQNFRYLSNVFFVLLVEYGGRLLGVTQKLGARYWVSEFNL